MRWSLIVFSIVFLTHFIYSNSKSLEFKYEMGHTNLMISMYIQEPHAYLSCSIRLNKRYTSLINQTETSFLFNHTISLEKQRLYKPFQMESTMYELTTPITINNIHDIEFHFINFPDNYSFENYIGLGYSFYNKKLSIVNQIKEAKGIDYSSFTFIPNSTNIEVGSFYIGEVSNEYIKGRKSGKCKVNGGLEEWTCNLKYVYVNGYKYINTDLLEFNTQKITEVPKEFYDFIKEQILKVEDSYSFSADYDDICGDIEYVTKMNDTIDFVIDNYKYHFLLRDFFKCNNRVCTFQLKTKKTERSKWVIGYDILQYYITTFDYEKGEVRLYEISDKMILLEKEEVTIDSVNIIQLCIIISTVLTFFSFVIIISRDSFFTYISTNK